MEPRQDASSTTFEEKSIEMSPELIDAVNNHLAETGETFAARVRFAVREQLQREFLRVDG